MCGIAGIVGPSAGSPQAAAALEAMIARQRHRGPDHAGRWRDPGGTVRLGHDRLAILDLSPAGRQPMADASGRLRIVLNGEIYNYRELREALGGRDAFATRSDTEVLLAAWRRWGPACLERLIGMFAFLLWDAGERRLYAVRDRFGVKPLYLHRHADGGLLLASEIAALHAAGVAREPEPRAWARYLVDGVHDQGTATFWRGVERLEAGCYLEWHDGAAKVHRWYDAAARVAAAGEDRRDESEAAAEYRALLEESVRLRFRADVPVGINLSGGVDSSTLLALVRRVGAGAVRAFTFVCGDERYDELPWVEAMLAGTDLPLEVCPLAPAEVPALAASVAAHQDEPFGGLPSLAYARLFEHARARGAIVLLDGQGMDEQWAGYDYHRHALDGDGEVPPWTVQGVREAPLRPACVSPELRRLAAEDRARCEPGLEALDPLRALQLRDLTRTKLPRALRFNDRVSMRASCELREPFLDHRLVELAVRQPAARKIAGGRGKAMLRRLAADLVPGALVEAPKRALQTPQREWLRGPLAGWVDATVERAIDAHGGWLLADEVRAAWSRFRAGEGDNSFFVWQWLGLGLLADAPTPAPAVSTAARSSP